MYSLFEPLNELSAVQGSFISLGPYVRGEFGSIAKIPGAQLGRGMIDRWGEHGDLDVGRGPAR